MDNPKASCPTKKTLVAAWRNAAEIYSRAVAELSQKIGIVPKSEYERLVEAAEKARKHALEAQANLEAHTNDHGCDDNGEVAA
jgi:uncharacterized small protein (DUF1192 family)